MLCFTSIDILVSFLFFLFFPKISIYVLILEAMTVLRYFYFIHIFIHLYIYTVYKKNRPGQRLLTATTRLAGCARPQSNTCRQTAAQGFNRTIFLFFCYCSFFMFISVLLHSLEHPVVWNHLSLSSKCIGKISRKITFRRIVSSVGGGETASVCSRGCQCCVCVCVSAHSPFEEGDPVSEGRAGHDDRRTERGAAYFGGDPKVCHLLLLPDSSSLQSINYGLWCEE